MSINKNIEQVLFTKQQIKRRIDDLSKQIEKDYKGKPLTIIPILNGSFVFASDLIRQINLDITVSFVGASSYRDGTISQDLKITQEINTPLENKNILLLDDILDTGKTLTSLKERILLQNPLSLKTIVLLDKPAGRTNDLRADYAAFTVDNYFVVGYGLDYAERYRHLPYIGVLKKGAI